MRRVLGLGYILGVILSVWCLSAPVQAAEQKDIPIQQTYFPDVRFRWYLLEHVDKDQDGILSEEERLAVIRLGSTRDNFNDDPAWDDVWNWLHYMESEKGNREPDATLKGLEYFPNLEEFYWCNTSINLPALDLSGNPKLRVLELSYANVSARGPYRLDLSANHALKSLTLDLNLDEDELILPADAAGLEKNISLDGTVAVNGDAQIPKPAPAQAIKPGALSEDGKGDIRITKNIFPGNKFRRYLYVRVDANWDGILSETERMAVSRMGDFAVGLDTDELCWDYMWNSFQEKKMDFTGIGYFPNIEEMRLTNLTITNLDFRQFKRLRTLSSYNSKYPNLTTLDLSENMELENLSVEGAEISTLDVRKNKKLKSLFVWKLSIKSLDLTENTELEDLSVNFSKLSSLNVKNNRKLKKLTLFQEDKIKSLDLSKNKELKRISVSHTKLATLDVRKNRKLKSLFLCRTKVKTLNLKKNSKLVSLNCSNNFLKKLDLSKCPKLKELNCQGNQLTKLILSKKIKKMKSLNCSKNRLKKIQIRWIKIKSLKKDKKTKI